MEPISRSAASPPPTLVSSLCRPNHEPSFLSGSQNCQPFGGGGQFAGAFQPAGGVHPGGGVGQLGGGLYFGISCPSRFAGSALARDCLSGGWCSPLACHYFLVGVFDARHQIDLTLLGTLSELYGASKSSLWGKKAP